MIHIVDVPPALADACVSVPDHYDDIGDATRGDHALSRGQAGGPTAGAKALQLWGLEDAVRCARVYLAGSGNGTWEIHLNPPMVERAARMVASFMGEGTRLAVSVPTALL